MRTNKFHKKYEFVANLMVILLLVMVDIYIPFLGKSISSANIFLILITFLSLFEIFRNTNFFLFEKHEFFYILFWIYSFCMCIITCLIYNYSIPFEYLLHIFEMIAILIIFRRYLFNSYYFFKMLYVISIALIVLVFFQEFQKISIGTFITFSLKNMQDVNRPAALFSEPAHYSLYITLVIFSCLFDIDSLKIDAWKRIIFSAIASLTAIMSMSASGLIYVGLLWIIWFFSYSKIYKRLQKFITFAVASSAGLYIIFNKNWIAWSLSHIKDMDINKITSGSFRIFRGFSIYAQLKPLEKIFGIGAGLSAQYITGNHITTIYDGVENIGSNYTSALSLILLTAGIIGFVLYFLFLFYSTDFTNIKSFIAVALYILYIISNENLYSPQMIVLLLLIFYLKDKIVRRVER